VITVLERQTIIFTHIENNTSTPTTINPLQTMSEQEKNPLKCRPKNGWARPDKVSIRFLSGMSQKIRKFSHFFVSFVGRSPNPN
jgi:hypothetical protein